MADNQTRLKTLEFIESSHMIADRMIRDILPMSFTAIPCVSKIGRAHV